MGQAASHLNGTGPALIKASRDGDADAVTELISTNPQLLHYCTFRHLGPCHYAARGDHVEVLLQLVAKAQEVEQLQWQAEVAAVSGADRVYGRKRQQHASLVKQLVNACSDRGVTPLMLAVDKGSVVSVKLLLEKGADPWAVDKLGGRTALHYAARRDDPEIAEALVEAAGSSGPVQFPNRTNTSYVDVRNQTGFTAVHFAVHSNSQQALAVLLNLGANPLLSSLFDCLDAINCPKGTTALHLAARQGNKTIAKQLLRAYVEHSSHMHLPDPRLLLDGDNLLPCQVAARRSHPDAARMLLPSHPIASLFVDGDLTLVGPPSLAAMAGAVLRATLAQDLDQAVQQQQQQGGGAATGAADAGTWAAAESAAAQEGSFGLAGSEASDGEESELASETFNATDETLIARTDSCSSRGSADSAASSSMGEQLCGVCLDEPSLVQLAPCGHQLCAGCCKSLLALNSRCVMACPFCRGGVAHLAPVCQAVAACGGVHEAAPPLRVGHAVALTTGTQMVL